MKHTAKTNQLDNSSHLSVCYSTGCMQLCGVLVQYETVEIHFWPFEEIPRVRLRFGNNRHSVIVCGAWFNSMRPSDAIRRHGPASTMFQVMAWCLTAPSHYPNECWLIVRWNITHIVAKELAVCVFYLDFYRHASYGSKDFNPPPKKKQNKKTKQNKTKKNPTPTQGIKKLPFCRHFKRISLKRYEFWFEFNWSLLAMVQLTS